MSSLFRPESLHNQRQSWLGSIHVMQPLGLVWLTFGVLATLVAASTFLFWAELPRTVRLPGLVLPDRGLIRVQSAQPGQLQRVVAVQGQAVQAGDALFTVAVDLPGWARPAEAGLKDSFEARLRSLTAAQRQTAEWQAARQTALAERLAGRRAELAQLDQQAQWARQRLAVAEQSLARLQTLKDEAFVSAAGVQDKREDVLGLKADSAAIERQRQALDNELTALEAERRELPLKTAERVGEIERERAEVAELAAREEAQAAQRHWVVRAPADGVLTALHASAGQPVSAGVALATMTPAGARLQAQLFAPSSALGFLRPGQTVQLRVQAYPYQKFGLLAGHIEQVAQAPLQAQELTELPLAATALAGGQPLYRLTVALPEQGMPAAGGPPRPLLAAMQLEADVVLERRRLVEWLFEPLLGWWRR